MQEAPVKRMSFNLDKGIDLLIDPRVPYKLLMQKDSDGKPHFFLDARCMQRLEINKEQYDQLHDWAMEQLEES